MSQYPDILCNWPCGNLAFVFGVIYNDKYIT